MDFCGLIESIQFFFFPPVYSEILPTFLCSALSVWTFFCFFLFCDAASSRGTQLTPINLILCQSWESKLQMKHSENHKFSAQEYFPWDTYKIAFASFFKGRHCNSAKLSWHLNIKLVSFCLHVLLSFCLFVLFFVFLPLCLFVSLPFCLVVFLSFCLFYPNSKAALTYASLRSRADRTALKSIQWSISLHYIALANKKSLSVFFWRQPSPFL